MIKIHYDRKIFFDTVRAEPFKGSFTQQQVDGINYLLDTWEEHYGSHPQKHLAYCLATAFWETGRTMMPVPEVGRGRGHKYGRPAGPYNQIYYGRGHVQLTWHRNYVHAGGKIGVNLEKNPDSALIPGVSARVLFQGCLEGWFTGKKLSDYKTYTGMRRVVNGTDKASTIAAFAVQFERAVLASAKEITDTPTETNTGIWTMISKLLNLGGIGGLGALLGNCQQVQENTPDPSTMLPILLMVILALVNGGSIQDVLGNLFAKKEDPDKA